MGIEKLTKFSPKLRDFTKKLSKEKTCIERCPFKLHKTVQNVKFNTRPKTPLEEIERMVVSQAKRTIGLFVEDFTGKKQNLIQELSKVCDKNVIARIEKAENPEQLAKILAEEEWMPIGKYAKYMIDGKFVKNSNTDKIVKPLSLEIEQINYQSKSRRATFVLARERAMHLPSKNPKVIAIENILKEHYGCKFVSLKDNEDLARTVLKVYETAAKNGVKTPKNVIASDYILGEGENLLNGTIMLNNRRFFLPKGCMSTNSDFHGPLHEIMHDTHPRLMAFTMKKIPARFQKVKDELSIYSSCSETHETFTELNTKRLIEGLNPEEQSLFDYLNIFA